MKLELFDFIEDTLNLIDQRRDSIEEVASHLEKFFTNSFFIDDHFLNVSYRIKSAESLREKILRHNFFLRYETPENLFNNLSDLIGFRIECRFIEDEKKIYKDIVELFNIEVEDGFYISPLNSHIMLQLAEKQPQVQKNGFEIYKIDGKYEKDDVKINFELQIKSLVNIFWGEIDHRVLYKNFNYMLKQDFFRDIMSSIKDNLSMIDRQLMLVHDHLNGMDASDEINKKEQLQELLSKIIHDIYVVKVRKEIGFVVDFKKSTDVIVDYIFIKGGVLESDNYSENFLRVLNRLNDISREDISFTGYIDFEREPIFNDSFTRKIGKAILDVLNKDFRWNLFFKIIFDIEEGNNAEDFEGFLIYIRYRFYEAIMLKLEELDFDFEYREDVVEYVLDGIAEVFCKEVDVDFLCSCSIDELNHKSCSFLDEITNINDWHEYKSSLNQIILEHKF